MAQTLFLLFGMMVIIKNKKIKATMLHFFLYRKRQRKLRYDARSYDSWEIYFLAITRRYVTIKKY